MRDPHSRRWGVCLALALLTGLVAASAAAQFGFRGRLGIEANSKYDGRFTFARLRYMNSSAWNHDYPRADRHLVRILSEVSFLRTNTDGGNVFRLDDPQLFKYPIAYMSEPGYWDMSEREARSLRAYLLKGGFLIFDDFEGEQWNNMAEQMRRVLPDGRWVKIDVPHTLFDSFFRMKSVDFPHPMTGAKPNYQVIFEDNDPAKRIMVVANHDNDVAEYWEWSDTGFAPIELSNEAYKLGVNYIVYAVTH